MNRLPARGLVAACWLAVAMLTSPAFAQSVNLSGQGGSPIEIYADNGIEWQQDGEVFIARGNARAVRGNLTINADVLRAFYRKSGNEGTQVWRLDAYGHVIITTPGEKAFGDNAVYHVDQAVFVLHADKGRVRLVTKQDVITAKQQIEYWQDKALAVARGDAMAVRADRRLSADVLTAHFVKDKNGENHVEQVSAFDHVRIQTQKDVVTADRGIYYVDTGMATLTGSVKITRGKNQLDGCTAVVNLNTGITKLKSCGTAVPGRVRGLIQPGSVKGK